MLLAVVELVVDGLAVDAVPESGCFAGAGASPPTGVVPGAGCAVCDGCCDAVGLAAPPAVEVVCAPPLLAAAGAVLVCVVLGEVPPACALACAHTPTLAASAIPARTVILKTMRSVALMTLPPPPCTPRLTAPLRSIYIDASMCQLDSKGKNTFPQPAR